MQVGVQSSARWPHRVRCVDHGRQNRLDDSVLAKYAGAYRLGPAGGDGRLSVVNGASVLHVTMLDMRLVPESERSFFVDDDPRTPVQFAIDASGKVTDLILLRNGTEQMRMPRVQ